MPPEGYKTITVPDTLYLALNTLAKLKGYTSVAEFLRAKLEVLRYA